MTGAIIATACVFLPALLLVVIPVPLSRRNEDHPRLQGFVKGATAAAAGAIAGAALSIAGDVITRPASIVIAVIALGLLLQTRPRSPSPHWSRQQRSSGSTCYEQDHPCPCRVRERACFQRRGGPDA
jgi:hypothetical protein